MKRFWFPVKVCAYNNSVFIAWRGWRRPAIDVRVEGPISALEALAMPPLYEIRPPTEPLRVSWNPATIVAALAVGFALGQWLGVEAPQVTVPFDVQLVQPKPPEVTIQQRGGYALPPVRPKENQP